ncbi:uncharacterized protein [Dasypus novemcinctus]|uniref:uncharacterized protein n=1 Tax=Dasypus novemcinctus TaxID=9361 RepID=UPI0039C9C7C1
MGQAESSHSLFICQVKEALETRGVKVKKKSLTEFFKFIIKTCPWFPEEGTIDAKRWSRVGDCLTDYYKTFGPERVPVTAFSYWQLVQDVLGITPQPPDIKNLVTEGETALKLSSQPPSGCSKKSEHHSQPHPSRPSSPLSLISLYDVDTEHLRPATPSAPSPEDGNGEHNPKTLDKNMECNLEPLPLPPFKPPPYGISSNLNPPFLYPLALMPSLTNLKQPPALSGSSEISELHSEMRSIRELTQTLISISLPDTKGKNPSLAFPILRSGRSTSAGRRPPASDRDLSALSDHSMDESREDEPQPHKPEPGPSHRPESGEDEPRSTKPEPTPLRTSAHVRWCSPSPDVYRPLNFKTIEKLKKVVHSYGPTAPFTLALIEALGDKELTPNDWFQLAKAVLSGGDFITWRLHYEEAARECAIRNEKKEETRGRQTRSPIALDPSLSYLPPVLSPYLSLTAALITKARQTSCQLFGKDPDSLIVPYTQEQVNWLFQTDGEWAIACSSFAGDIDNHYPANPLIQFAKSHLFTFPKITKQKPIDPALLVFTDGSANGTAAYVTQDQVFSVPSPYASAQLVELYAVLQVFSHLPNQPFNLYTDSAYIAHSLPLLETTPFIKPSSNAVPLFSEIQKAILARQHPFFIGHLCAHQNLPGPLAKGNALADAATRLTCLALSTPLTLATQAHAQHHLNANTLRQKFNITREQAREIVKTCKNCVTQLPIPHLGVNPRGLIPNEVWQMDVTHLTSFGQLKYIHVCIDTYSGFILASLQSGEASKHVISHLLHCFSILGQPKVIKTDNGPGYTGKNFQTFSQQLQINHIMGIPYNPQGQGIIECAHRTLKNALGHLTESFLGLSKQRPRDLLHHALFVLNFLTLDIDGQSATDRHWHPASRTQQATVMWRDPLTSQWNGPDPVNIWGRGSTCIYDQ